MSSLFEEFLEISRERKEEITDKEKAVELFSLAAEQGLAEAQFNYGFYLIKGNPDFDIDQVLYWMKKAAEQGLAEAQFHTAKLLNGQVIARMMTDDTLDSPPEKEQLKEVIQWYTKAAEQGHAYAQFFVDRQSKQTPPNVILGVSRVLHHMSRIFHDNALLQTNQGGLQIDRKRRKQLQRKRIALGHKANDHEDLRYSGPNLSM